MQLGYKFKSTDQNFINAIMMLFPEMKIDVFKIVHPDGSEQEYSFQYIELKKLNDLIQSIKNDLQSDTMIHLLTEEYEANHTSWYALPAFEPQKEYLEHCENDRKKYQDSIVSVKNHIISSDRDMDSQSLPNICNQEDAWKVTHLVHDELKKYGRSFSSVIDNPSEQTMILFISKRHLFTISYGQKLNSITKMDHGYPAFDIDDGFVSRCRGLVSPDVMVK